MPVLALKPDVWIGIEPTINRTENFFMNQCERSGHFTREGDIQAFARLGIKKIRYPFLWETIAPIHPSQLDNEQNWQLFDQKMRELKKYRLEPIVGLLHHGSGPAYTSLLDTGFAQLFATFAKRFAERYPDITDYTPINEPLTTARFSGLYGVWFPHHRSDLSFLRAFVHQIRGTVLAMRAIREVNPKSRLIQTEDFGMATSTRKLNYQARFENERRWLTFDVLSGRFNRKHRLWKYCSKHLSPEELNFLCSCQTIPSILGINHYPTSNRYLDEKKNRYPEHFQGGNQRHTYADVGTSDWHPSKNPPLSRLLGDVWKRYQLPIAITEIHTHGARDRQLRWIRKVISEVSIARRKGACVQAVTVWSALGNYDWNSLCTRQEDYYEPGIFDVRSGERRPTAIAKLVIEMNHSKNWKNSILMESLEKGHFLLYPCKSFIPKELLEKCCAFRGLNFKVHSLNTMPKLSQKTWGILCMGKSRMDPIDSEFARAKLPRITLQLPDEADAETTSRLINEALDHLIDGANGQIDITNGKIEFKPENLRLKDLHL